MLDETHVWGDPGIEAGWISTDKRKIDRFFLLMPDMLCIAGFDGYFKQLNPAWETTLGYSTEELLSKPYIELVHPDDREATGIAASRREDGKVLSDFQNRYLAKDGSWKWLSWRCTADVKRKLIYGTARDITERKITEEKLLQSQFFLDSIIDNIPAMVFVKDAQYLRFVRYNRTAEELLGHSEDELLGKSDYDFFPKEKADFFTEKDRETPNLGKLLDIPEEYLHTRDKGVRILHTKKIPIVDRSGKATHLLGVSEDITESKRTEEELKKQRENLETMNLQLQTANKELEAFSYSVSHDLRAPLRHMGGFVEALQRHSGTSLDAKGQRYLKIIGEAARKMGCLIDDLLAFSQMGRSEMQKKEIDLNQLVLQVQGELEPEFNERKIHWKIHPLPCVFGDKSMIQQVLVNLISNAVKYTCTRRQAEIEIGCNYQNSLNGEESGEDVFFVRDNGVGFDMRYVDKLFGVFQRLHPAKDFEGTGIGLANVQRIIHRHGGRTWAEGIVDHGATFFFSLPSSHPDSGEIDE